MLGPGVSGGAWPFVDVPAALPPLQQRLEEENRETLGLIKQLIARVDELEQEQEQLVVLVQQAQQAQQRRGLFGGFFSAKAA